MQLLKQTSTPRTALLTHSIYQQVNDLKSLQVFMKSHVFAVWDFMTLLKTLQRQLTCIELPWIPPIDIHSARLVNEIVLVEETDEITPGYYLSHFHLYLAAMEEVGADSQPIRDFITAIQQGFPANEALANLPIPESTKTFVMNTLKSANGLTHEVAAVFLLGREDVIPKMFQQILTKLEDAQGIPCNSFRLYLERHTHIDEEQHAPMGKKLLRNICGNDSLKWMQAVNAANNALKVRHCLWDGINQSIQQ
ncbi:hypothetical protein BCD67_18880 [Oscillatoriales cyanobacterium USR001]|nr:hypothetical protein BCD67_18880 [Oscillatoriales cyanobacterium USR001]